MGGASKAALKELLRVNKFVLDTSDYWLNVKPIMENNIWILQ